MFVQSVAALMDVRPTNENCMEGLYLTTIANVRDAAVTPIALDLAWMIRDVDSILAGVLWHQSSPSREEVFTTAPPSTITDIEPALGAR